MSSFHDLFDKAPPESHARNVEAAVAPLLADLRREHRKRFFIFLGASTTSFALSALFISRFLKEESPVGDSGYALNGRGAGNEESSSDDIAQLLEFSDDDVELLNEMEMIADISQEDFELLIQMAKEADRADG